MTLLGITSTLQPLVRLRYNVQECSLHRWTIVILSDVHPKLVGQSVPVKKRRHVIAPNSGSNTRHQPRGSRRDRCNGGPSRCSLANPSESARHAWRAG